MSDSVRVALTETRDMSTCLPRRAAELKDLDPALLETIRRENVEHHIDLAEAAANMGVQVICFGEMFTGPYFATRFDEVFLGMAECARTGPTVRTLQKVARDLNMVIVAPIYELEASTGLRYNTAVVIDADGDWLGCYRKTHIPVGQNDKGQFKETLYFGRSLGDMDNDGPTNISTNPYYPVFATAAGNIGVMICYDRHFEGVVRALSTQGAQLIFCPAVTFGTKSERMWEAEFATDASRHNVFIGGSNRKGSERPWNQPFFGRSYFVGPNGRLADLSERPELIVADVDLGALERPDPAGWNIARDIREEIY